MSRESFNGVGGPSAVALLCAALTLFASCGAENPSSQDGRGAPTTAPASNTNTSSGPAGGQNAGGSEPLQGSRFGTRLSNQSVGAGINDNSNANARGGKKSKPAGKKKR